MNMNIKLIKQVHDNQKITYQTIGEDKLKVVIQDVDTEDVLQELYYSFDNIEVGKIYDLDEYVFSVSKDEDELSLELIYFAQEDNVDEELDVDALIEQVELDSLDGIEFVQLSESVFSSAKEVNWKEENDRLKSEIHGLKQQIADGKRENEKMLLDYTQENELLTKKIDVLSEQLEFRDDLIQELALMVFQ